MHPLIPSARQQRPAPTQQQQLVLWPLLPPLQQRTLPPLLLLPPLLPLKSQRSSRFNGEPTLEARTLPLSSRSGAAVSVEDGRAIRAELGGARRHGPDR
jgi:hypothetical protein